MDDHDRFVNSVREKASKEVLENTRYMVNSDATLRDGEGIGPRSERGASAAGEIVTTYPYTPAL